jgi:hypothetical protein
VKRAETLAWLGIEPWFVRKPLHSPKPTPKLGQEAEVVSQRPPAHENHRVNLLALPTSATPNLAVPPAPDSNPLDCPAAGSPSSAERDVVHCAPLNAPPDPLWVAVHRSIPAARTVVHAVAAHGLPPQIQIGTQVWTLQSLRQNPLEKKQLWRLLVGIDG